MRIACPNCQATYEVPNALIGAGRMLRCAKCGHDWRATGEAALPGGALPGAAPELKVVPATTPPGHEPATGDLPPPTPAQHRLPQLIDPPLPASRGQRPSPGALTTLWAAWIVSALLLGMLGTAAWVYRGPIMEAWPPAARVYLLFGATREG
jgi:predicted Zn finger-like uncharacterized protein